MLEQSIPMEAAITLMQRHQWIKRRNEPRYQCGPATSSRLVSESGQTMHRAWVQNLSVTGVGLLLSQALDLETCLVVQLRAGNGRQYELPARVVHCTQQISNDYLIGCEFFQKLTPDDLDALL